MREVSSAHASDSSYGRASARRARLFDSAHYPRGLDRPQRAIKRRSLVRRALGPGASAMAGDDAAHVGKADARAFELVLAVQPLENAEELFGVSHVETHAVIAHEKNDPA